MVAVLVSIVDLFHAWECSRPTIYGRYCECREWLWL